MDVKFEPLTASAEEREMTVTDVKGGSITRKGLLVGEVWFTSGQSNMDWLASKSMCSDLASTLAKSKVDIPIREYTVGTGSALYPCSRASFKDTELTDQMMWIWSGDTLMDLQRNEALKIVSKTLDGSDYLFVEAGGFAVKNAPDWKPQWLVMKRTGK